MLYGSHSSHLAVAAPVGELIHLERLGAFNQVWQVEVTDVVADDYVRVCLNHQVSPPLQNSILDLMLVEYDLTMLSVIYSISAYAHTDLEVDLVAMRPPVGQSMRVQEHPDDTGLALTIEE